MNSKDLRRFWWSGIVLLFLLAFALRVADLESVPPGLTHDEASNGHDAAAILRGVHRIYFPVGYGHEPLYNYSVALFTAMLGQGIFTLRFTTVVWSLLTWALTVALARRWWGRRAALFTAAALTVAFWPLAMARVGLRAPVLPPLLAASVLAYDRALAAPTPRRAWAGYLLSGFFLGAGFYTYMASRGMVLLYPVSLLAMAFLNRERFLRAWRGTLVTVLVALLVGLPLYLHLRAHPELETRVAQLGGAITSARAGDFTPLWENVRASLPLLVLRADPQWLYQIAGRPALEPLLAAGFLTGLLVAVARPARHSNALLLVWLAGGLAPALLAPVEYNTLHAIAALPPAFLLAARGWDVAWRAIARRPGMRTAAALLLGAALLATGVEASYAYFVIWGQNPLVRTLYHHHVVALGRHLDASPAQLPAVITSLTPGEFHDPYTMEVTLRREDLTLRWVNGQGALFFPDGQSRLYVEAQSALHPLLTPGAMPDAAPLLIAPGAQGRTVQGCTWDAEAVWQELLAEAETTVDVAPGDPPPGQPHAAASLPVVYGGRAALVGYRVVPATSQEPGTTLSVLTVWEVRAPSPEELVLFSHLLDASGNLGVQADRLDAPTWQWAAGDRFAQVHTLTLPEDLPPGEYGLAVGLYARETLARLPLAAEPGATRVLIPLEITPPGVKSEN